MKFTAIACALLGLASAGHPVSASHAKVKSSELSSDGDKADGDAHLS